MANPEKPVHIPERPKAREQNKKYDLDHHFKCPNSQNELLKIVLYSGCK